MSSLSAAELAARNKLDEIIAPNGQIDEDAYDRFYQFFKNDLVDLNTPDLRNEFDRELWARTSDKEKALEYSPLSDLSRADSPWQGRYDLPTILAGTFEPDDIELAINALNTKAAVASVLAKLPKMKKPKEASAGSRNPGWGFFNTVSSNFGLDTRDVDKVWNHMAGKFAKKAGCSLQEAEMFLDSSSGRMMADALTFFTKEKDVDSINKAITNFVDSPRVNPFLKHFAKEKKDGIYDDVEEFYSR